MGRTVGAWSHIVRAGTEARRQAWQAMRIMRRFSRGDIQATADITEDNLLKFVRGLQRCGFLRLEEARVSGRPGSVDRFRLIRDNGPLPPVLHKDGTMTDPNTGEQFGEPRGGDGERSE